MTTFGLELDDLTAQTAARAATHAAPQVATHADRLHRWEPECWPVSPDWQPTVSRFLGSESAQRLGAFVQKRLKQGAIVYPPQPFFALKLTPLERVKVVILGQDPYHGPGQAQGLAFSVAAGLKLPPSLRNIFKEIAKESGGRKAHTPTSGSLQDWASQGVLLLNTCLTVEQGQPASHAKRGWEALTDLIIQTVARSKNPVVFMLWGAHAQGKQDLLLKSTSVTQAPNFAPPAFSAAPRLVLTANHPSPLSALRPPRPFIGCNHFCAANAFLLENGLEPVQWA